MLVACGHHRGDEVSRDGIVAVHSDGGGGITNIGDGFHIASPSEKLGAGIRSRHQVDHRSFVIGKCTLSGRGYRTSRGAGDSEVIRPTTACHP